MPDPTDEALRTIWGGIDSAWWLLRNAHNHDTDEWPGFVESADLDRGKAYEALNTLREEVRKRPSVRYPKSALAQLDEARDEIAKLRLQMVQQRADLRAQLERQEAALRDIGFATLHCTHGTKVRNILKRRGLSTPPNQGDTMLAPTPPDCEWCQGPCKEETNHE